MPDPNASTVSRMTGNEMLLPWLNTEDARGLITSLIPSRSSHAVHNDALLFKENYVI